ncbi:DUF4178 domain-containing protein [Saccharicrinis fermentans]|uniref:DUF4178 domain-containing protein n=1 Tax=Saccharicrinis fermentans DSM 9555 = JCM 21142 TaxID=869213 RepID=W7YFN8_9BACT|nr:DUF4178 domain-containing protein [Saccharicrinis fermentans]GAF01424.1 hypothetical protein JCM21142_31 [Saccharicrinis fermentans DSM 9555 = JCM 21142]
MGIFDIFKKKEPHYDSTNIRVQDLDVGFVFEYDLSTWEVQAIYEYDWGDDYFTREFKVSNGALTRYLAIEEDDELEISLSEKVKIRTLGVDLMSSLMERQKPPQTINYNGVSYLLEKEAPGYFHDIAKGDSWEEFRSWDFVDKEGKHILTIEQWGDKEFEASVGIILQEFEISNILPASN